ncbi:MAG: hypothetical protein K8T90_01510 [Planctomycetes bacterium]|nr:hypothetical protein [Planctomycetota bacterium]
MQKPRSRTTGVMSRLAELVADVARRLRPERWTPAPARARVGWRRRGG